MNEQLEIRKPKFHPSLLHQARLELSHGRHELAIKTLGPEIDKDADTMIKIERLRLLADSTLERKTVSSVNEAVQMCEAALSLVEKAPTRLRSLSELTLMCSVAEAMRVANVTLQPETAELITEQVKAYKGPAKDLLKYFSERTLGLNSLPDEAQARAHLSAAREAMIAHNESYRKNPTPMSTEIPRDGILESAHNSGLANLNVAAVHQPGPAMSTLLHLPLG